MRRVYINKISGVEGVLIGKKSKNVPYDIFIIKTKEGREYFGPSREFEFVRFEN